MFKIAFYLFDYKDGSFKKVYFHHWNDSKPVFTKNKRRAQEYFDERLEIGVSSLPYVKAWGKLKEKQHFEVLAAFAQWGLEQEEAE